MDPCTPTGERMQIMVRGSSPTAPGPVPPDAVNDAGARMGEYLGAEEGAHEEPPGCALTLLVAVPLTIVGAGFLGWHGSALIVTVGIVLVLAAIGVAVFAWRLPGRPFPVLYRFDHGAVVSRPSGAVTAYSWSALVPYAWSQLISIGQAANEHVIPWLQLRTRQDEVVATFTWDGARRVRLQVARPQLTYAEELLAGEGEVRYGAFRLTRQSLMVNDQLLPWSVVRSVGVENDSLAVRRHGSGQPVARVDRKATPHEHMLLTLVARQVAANDPTESA